MTTPDVEKLLATQGSLTSARLEVARLKRRIRLARLELARSRVFGASQYLINSAMATLDLRRPLPKRGRR